MLGLDLLGAAAPSEARLQDLVAAQVGGPVSELRGRVEQVPYEVPSITTAGRWWVRGETQSRSGGRRFSFFVKTVRPWELSPLFEQVPPAMRALAATGFPWRTEPAVYRSDLGDVLPAGLRMPRAYDVVDLPGPMAALWLEEIVQDAAGSAPWEPARFVAAARLLGRLAASPATRERARLGDFPLSARGYLEGRVAAQVVPVLRSDVWQQPGLEAFADLRDPLLSSLEQLPALVAEIDALPRLAGHGDACPNNLLTEAAGPDGFVLIDDGLWNELPLAHDLSQLLVGEIQLGRRAADDLQDLDEAVLLAYAEGLALEGYDVDLPLLRRAHALQLHLFAGLSGLPVELLGAPVDELAAVATGRAAITRLALDQLSATGAE